MTGWHELEVVLSGVPLAMALVALGLAVGVLTGMFGVGGAFIIMPLLISVFRIDSTVAVGSSLCFTLGAAAAGFARHRRFGNFEPRSLILIAIPAALGVIGGKWCHEALKTVIGDGDVRAFDRVMEVVFAVFLFPLAVMVWREPRTLGDERRALLQRIALPPYVDLPRAGLKRVSASGIALVGLQLGVLQGFLGVGGGVFLMPVLILVVGLTPHVAVGTSLGAMVLGSLVGTVEYARDGAVNLWLAMIILIGSTVGIQIGAKLCQRMDPQRLRRYFALLIALMIVPLLLDALSRSAG